MKDPLANLTSNAIEDFGSILDRSLTWGSARAEKTRRELIRRSLAIGSGEAIGRQRADLRFRQPTRCLTAGPHVVICDPERGIVLRIIDGRRDFRRITEDDRSSE